MRMGTTLAKVTRLFSADEVEDLDLPYTCHTEWYNGNDHRWSYGRTGVFELDGDNWEIDWQIPASELQEDGEYFPWEKFPITATKVVHLPVVKKEWIPVDV